MSAPVVLSARGSHLYPGAADPASGTAAGPCLVAFADGSAALGSLVAAEGRSVLALGPYTTARGTAIPARRWAASLDGAPAEFRILARLPSPCG